MDSQDSNWDRALEHAALTDVGLRRANNQESHAVALAGDREFWQQRARDAGSEKAYVPLWGERIVWSADEEQTPPQGPEVEPEE